MEIEDTSELDSSVFVLVYTDPRKDYIKVAINSEDNTDYIHKDDLLAFAERCGGNKLRIDVKNLLSYYGNPFVIFTKQHIAKQLTMSTPQQSRADLKLDISNL